MKQGAMNHAPTSKCFTIIHTIMMASKGTCKCHSVGTKSKPARWPSQKNGKTNLLIRDFIRLGILVEVAGQQRGRAYVFQRYLALFLS
jgi:hypothetical protein